MQKPNTKRKNSLTFALNPLHRKTDLQDLWDLEVSKIHEALRPVGDTSSGGQFNVLRCATRGFS